jgi:hypothetical protein
LPLPLPARNLTFLGSRNALWVRLGNWNNRTLGQVVQTNEEKQNLDSNESSYDVKFQLNIVARLRSREFDDNLKRDRFAKWWCIE